MLRYGFLPLVVLLLMLIPDYPSPAAAQVGQRCDEVAFEGAAQTQADIESLNMLYERRWGIYSPSCRYESMVFRSLENPDTARLYIVWDRQNGERVIEITMSYQSGFSHQTVPLFIWHPNETDVLIARRLHSTYPGMDTGIQPFYLYNLNTGTSVELTCPNGCAHPMFEDIYWDKARNWLWANGNLGITAFDRDTGLAVRTFRNPTWGSIYAGWKGHHMQFSPDGSHVIIYSFENSGYNDSMTVYSITPMIHYDLNLEGYVPMIPRYYGYNRVCGDLTPYALSPDNRYLAVGYTAIRVWDLQNLSTSYEARVPLYRHSGPNGAILCLHFVSDRVVETISNFGTVERWHIETGVSVE